MPGQRWRVPARTRRGGAAGPRSPAGAVDARRPLAGDGRAPIVAIRAAAA